MGNTLPANPTRADYLKHALKASPDRATEIYQNISRELKIEKKWQEAIDTMILCANLQSGQEKGKSLVEIANLYNKLNCVDKYIAYLQEATDFFIVSGSFSTCAKYYVLIAEHYEKNLDYKRAIEYYTKAVDFYESSDMESNRNRYTIKIATLSAFDPSTLNGSIKMFEKLAETSSKNKFTNNNVPQYLLNAGLCGLLISDTETMKKKVETYAITYPIFSNRREYTFLNMILDAIENKDVNSFSAVIIDYDKDIVIDNWTCGILLKIKKIITENNLC